jgi:hypothetical protein
MSTLSSSIILKGGKTKTMANEKKSPSSESEHTLSSKPEQPLPSSGKSSESASQGPDPDERSLTSEERDETVNALLKGYFIFL